MAPSANEALQQIAEVQCSGAWEHDWWGKFAEGGNIGKRVGKDANHGETCDFSEVVFCCITASYKCTTSLKSFFAALLQARKCTTSLKSVFALLLQATNVRLL
jgi:hypothetical protein